MTHSGIIAAVVLAVCIVGNLCTATLQLRQVVVVHRHGARTPVPSVNQSSLCPGGANGCGLLTTAGKQMLTNLGRYLRARYNATIQPYDYYNSDMVHSQSTDVDRTIQSADCLLRGLYEHLDGTVQRVYPVVHTREIDRETELLPWDGWPALVMWSAATSVPFFTMTSKVTLDIISAEDLKLIGDEIGLSEECDPASPAYFPFQCAIDAEDFYSCAMTTGKTAALPITGKFYGLLVQCLESYNLYAMGKFDQLTNGGNFTRAVGTFGFPLAVDIIQRMKQSLPSGNPVPTMSPVLSHYSGHDITLIPLYNTLGNTTLLNPLFGAAMIFEVWAKDGATSSNSFFVTAKIGQPGQTPDTNFSYTFSNFTMSCMTNKRVVYQSSSGCPLGDFENYVLNRGPQSAMGTCYTSEATRAILNCTFSDPPTAPSYCNYYRSMCIDACGQGGAMTPQYECVQPGSSSASASSGPMLRKVNGVKHHNRRWPNLKR